MTEPTGHTIDGTPWEEARPPHLPDRLASVPRPAWPFLIVAAVIGLSELKDRASSTAPGTWPAAWEIVGVLGPVAMILVGAALFWRHPDAVRTHRRLAVGAVLITASDVLRVVQSTLGSSILAAADGTGMPPWVAVAYVVINALVGAAGVVFLAGGLADARRLPDRSTARPLSIALMALLAVMAATQVLAIVASPESTYPLESIALYVTANLTVAVWIYLAVVGARGRSAGEPLSRAWALVAAAGSLQVLAGATGWVAGYVISVFEIAFEPFLYVYTVLATLPALLLLAAFTLGIPVSSVERAATPPPVPPVDDDGPVLEDLGTVSLR